MTQDSKFYELFSEIESIQKGFDCGFLEALSFIASQKSEYNPVIRVQLDEFVKLGQEFFGEAECQ
jgi:hypothetical protein